MHCTEQSLRKAEALARELSASLEMYWELKLVGKILSDEDTTKESARHGILDGDRDAGRLEGQHQS